MFTEGGKKFPFQRQNLAEVIVFQELEALQKNLFSVFVAISDIGQLLSFIEQYFKHLHEGSGVRGSGHCVLALGEVCKDSYMNGRI
jgi:hypothetical protein